MSRVAWVVLVVGVAGCGDRDLWTRWQAERDLWHARRGVERLRINPRLASEADLVRAQEAFRAIERRYPADPWATPERLAHRYGRDVALQSGRAAIQAARLDEARGRPEVAMSGYERVMRDFAAVEPVRLEAALAQVAALERAGDPRAVEAWTAIGRDFPLLDAERGETIAAVLEAPLKAAQALRDRGQPAAAAAVLRDAEDRIGAAIARRPSARATHELWTYLARTRTEQADPARLSAALDAWRQALRGAESHEQASGILLGMGEAALAGGAPDTAMAYARWAEARRGRLGPEAMMLEARIWEQGGQADSAAAAYGRLSESFPNAFEVASLARFRRGELLERLGRWEFARSEYRALAAYNPSHEVTFESYQRIVAHHLDRHETELAEMEGENGVEALERVIATYHDAGVVRRARQARARLLIMLGHYAKACDALADLWEGYAGTPEGTSAALEAARVAEQELGDRARARRLYEEIAARGTPAEQQQAARAALARMANDGG